MLHRTHADRALLQLLLTAVRGGGSRDERTDNLSISALRSGLRHGWAGAGAMISCFHARSKRAIAPVLPAIPPIIGGCSASSSLSAST
ncbi:hypothetical protein, partial [Ensifer soli]|uniref:hypothetical protein n=1 Tax=Ciceribacter sp. sgz301302 TaxID=3342379 RepID=UPI0035BA11C9